MAISNQELIKEALQENGVVAEGEEPTAAQAQRALKHLNRMLAEWREKDVDLHWVPQTELSDNAPIAEWMEDGIIANLAIHTASKFRAAQGVTPLLAARADAGYKTIAARVMNDNLGKADTSHLPYGAGGRWDINLDTFT